MKTGLFITARLKSTRLKQKVLKPLKGQPMIWHMVQRLRQARRPDVIAVCTSPLEQDDPLAAFAAMEGIGCYRGDPDDVLLRNMRAAEVFGVDTIISCTADNPFVDPGYIDLLADYHVAEGNDYTRVEGLPWGTFSYALAYPAIVRACEIKAERDTEVWGGYFTQTGLFKTGVFSVADSAVRRPELRLTVDTPEDFAVVEGIFDGLYREGTVFPLADIIRYLDAHPELKALNAQVQQAAAKPIRLKEGVLVG